MARVDEFQRIDDLGQLVDLHVVPQRQAEHALVEVFGQRQRATTRVSNQVTRGPMFEYQRSLSLGPQAVEVLIDRNHVRLHELVGHASDPIFADNIERITLRGGQMRRRGSRAVCRSSPVTHLGVALSVDGRARCQGAPFLEASTFARDDVLVRCSRRVLWINALGGRGDPPFFSGSKRAALKGIPSNTFKLGTYESPHARPPVAAPDHQALPDSRGQ